MKKSTALAYLGPKPATVARRLGISRQAVHKWPDELPKSAADAVLAELARARARDRVPADPMLKDLMTA